MKKRVKGQSTVFKLWCSSPRCKKVQNSFGACTATDLTATWNGLIFFLLPMILFAFFLLAGKYLFFPGNPAAAEEKLYCSYTSIEIRPGDSLWSIATEYMTDDYDSVQDYVKEIKILNGLETDEIHAGRFLIIPITVQPSARAVPLAPERYWLHANQRGDWHGCE